MVYLVIVDFEQLLGKIHRYVFVGSSAQRRPATGSSVLCAGPTNKTIPFFSITSSITSSLRSSLIRSFFRFSFFFPPQFSVHL